MDLGIEGADIMCLAPHARQADRMSGISVIASQGSESRVVICTMASYSWATNASGCQSLRSDIVNNATTRAQSLALIVCDTNAVRRHVAVGYGTRRLLNQCPVIPMHDLLDLLRNPCNVEHLNELLNSIYKPDRKRDQGTAEQWLLNKRAKLENLPRL